MEIESDSECIHGLGPIICCVICNGRAKKEAELDKIIRKEDGEVIISFDFGL